jgi:hypothetical protein
MWRGVARALEGVTCALADSPPPTSSSRVGSAFLCVASLAFVVSRDLRRRFVKTSGPQIKYCEHHAKCTLATT